MGNAEKISVIVPVYNVENYLERCLDSILNQTYSDLEVLVIDDGSTDRSGMICDEYSHRDGRIRVFHREHSGQAEARNFGLTHAAGDYISCIDSDDYIESDMYASMLQKMDEDTDIVTCGINNLYPSCVIRPPNYVSYKAHTCSKYSNREAMAELLKCKLISFSCCDKLFRKSLFNNITFPAGQICEDLPVMYHLIAKSRHVVNIGETKYNYIFRSNSTSRQPFYPGKINFALFAQYILERVKVHYPELEKEAAALYINNVAAVLNDIAACPNPEDYNATAQELKTIIRRNVFHIFRNPYISEERKQLYFRLADEPGTILGKIWEYIT